MPGSDGIQKKRRLWAWRGFDVPDSVLASRKKLVSVARRRDAALKDTQLQSKPQTQVQTKPVASTINNRPQRAKSKSSSKPSDAMELDSDEE